MVTELLLYDKSFENVYTSMYLGTMQININEVHDENIRIIKLTKFFLFNQQSHYGRKHDFLHISKHILTVFEILACGA